VTHYFVDKSEQSDGTHIVHAQGCQCMATDKEYLGDLASMAHALMEARKNYWFTGGCVECEKHVDLAATLPAVGIPLLAAFDLPRV
jgi:hypothetical protein